MYDSCLLLKGAPRDLKSVRLKLPLFAVLLSMTISECLIGQSRGVVLTARPKRSFVPLRVRLSPFQPTQLNFNSRSAQPEPPRQRLQLLRELGQFVTGGTRLIGIFVIVFGDQSNVADGAVHFDRRGALLTRE